MMSLRRWYHSFGPAETDRRASIIAGALMATGLLVFAVLAARSDDYRRASITQAHKDNRHQIEACEARGGFPETNGSGFLIHCTQRLPKP